MVPMAESSNDLEQWNLVGARLRERDPVRFRRMLELAERAVRAHVNPITVEVTDGGDDLVSDEDCGPVTD